MSLSSFAKFLASLLFVLALPLFLVTSNSRWAINSPRLYTYGFDRYGYDTILVRENDSFREVSVTAENKAEVARRLIRYFNSREKFLQIQMDAGDKSFPLFNIREIVHLSDVKGLIQGVYNIQMGAAGYLFLFILVGSLWKRRLFLPALGRALLGGSILTWGLLGLLGLGVAVGFNALFYQFHILSFSNPFWSLDPAEDNLIRLFQQGFFRDATLFIAGASLAEAALLGGVGWWLRRRG